MTQRKRGTDLIQELDGQTRYMRRLHDVRERERGVEESSSKEGAFVHVPVPHSLIIIYITKRHARLLPAEKMIDPQEI